MTIPTMRERVARAIATVPHLAGQSANDWMLARADAALRELREPTEAMIEAGRWPAEDEGALAAWHAMIDTAIAKR